MKCKKNDWEIDRLRALFHTEEKRQEQNVFFEKLFNQTHLLIDRKTMKKFETQHPSWNTLSGDFY